MPELSPETMQQPPQVELSIETTNESVNADYAEMQAAYRRINGEESAAEEGAAPVRDEKGRFVSSAPEAEAVAAGDAEAVSTQVADEGAGAEPAGEAPQPEVVTPAPAHLPEAIKADWDKLSESARTTISAQQADFDRKYGEQSRQILAAKPINDVYDRLRGQYPNAFGQLDNATISEAVAGLAVVQMNLQHDPVRTIIDVAKQYGALEDLARVMNGQAPTGEGGQVRQLQQTITQLQQRLDNQINQFQSREAQGIEDAFRASGEAPHYDEVRAELPDYIEMFWRKLGQGTDPKTVLKQAYDAAVYANPVTRAKLQAPGNTAVQTPSPEKVAQVRLATSTNVKSTANGKGEPLSEMDEMRAAYRRAQSR